MTAPARPGLAEVLRGHIYEIGSQGRICRCGFRPSARPDLETLNALHTAHLAAVAEQWFTDRLAEVHGADLIAAERRRQIEVEGWTPEHDREHGSSILLRAAEAYEFDRSDYWPWDAKWWKPKDALSNLIRAGALYQAAADVGVGAGAPQAGVANCAAKIDGILAAVRAVLGGER